MTTKRIVRINRTYVLEATGDEKWSNEDLDTVENFLINIYLNEEDIEKFASIFNVKITYTEETANV